MKQLFTQLSLLVCIFIFSWIGAEAQMPAAATLSAPGSADADNRSDDNNDGIDKACGLPLHLRANLLRWATLTPDLGIEWRIREKWAVAVNASYTSWSWDGKDRHYGLWEVAPEVRRYLDADNRCYLGLIYKAGEFNYKLSDVGRQGDIMGGGITAGYVLPLNRTLRLDFSVGLGYIHAGYDRYRVIDGVRVRQGEESGSWWGPISAGITLVWKPF